MNVLVVYDTQFGNTERIARAIAGALEGEATVRVSPVAEAPEIGTVGLDLLVVGGPTQFWRASKAMRTWLDGLPTSRGLAVAAFDTRYPGSSWITGSAARSIARHLSRLGCRLVRPPESFLVAKSQGNPLLPGELERAVSWAATLLPSVTSPTAT